jgi:hypothetical protein
MTIKELMDFLKTKNEDLEIQTEVNQIRSEVKDVRIVNEIGRVDNKKYICLFDEDLSYLKIK